MTWLLPALVLLQTPATAPRVTLGTYSIGGRDVPATVPGEPGPLTDGARTLTVGEDKYLVSPEGRFIRRFRASGGWSEVREGYAAAKALITPLTPEWRVKVFVLPRTDILDVAPDGLARIRRATMEASEIAHVNESLARFAAMAEASGRGKIRIKVDVEVDHDPAYDFAGVKQGNPRPNVYAPYGPQHWEEYLRPRINGGLFEAEDRVYRGPYDSVFVVHSGLTVSSPRFFVNDSLVVPIAFYAEGLPLGREALANALFDGWTQQLGFAAFKCGYINGPNLGFNAPTPAEQSQGWRVHFSPDSMFTGSMWGSVFARDEATTEQYLARSSTEEPSPRDWADVSDNPFAKLPRLTLDQLAQRMGAKSLSYDLAKGQVFVSEGVEQPDVSGSSANNAWTPWVEASVVLYYGNGTRQLTLVNPLYTELFGKGLPASAEPKALGWLLVPGASFLVFDSKAIAPGKPEVAMLEVPGFEWKGPDPEPSLLGAGQETAFELSPSAGTANSLRATGGMALADAQDSERGEVLSVKVLGLVRTGELVLAGRPFGPAIVDPETHPFLSFWIRPQRAEPMEVVVYPVDKPEKTVGLFGEWPLPSEFGTFPSDPVQLQIVNGDAWQHVVIDLRKLGTGRVSAVALRASRFVGYWPSEQALPPTVLLDDIKITKTAPGPETAHLQTSMPAPDAASADRVARALFAAQATDATDKAVLTPLLRDGNDLVRLNAARAFQRIKHLEAEPGLVECLKSIEPRIAEAAVQALAFQGTPTAWEQVERAVRSGPFDYTRLFATQALATRKDPKDVATFSLMLTSRSAHGRRAGAEAIGPIAKGQQQLVLMAFLVELDPSVRLAATRGADMSVEDVCKRVLWSAVNDPSDEVRAWSCMRLIQSGTAKYVNEGLKGVRDESLGMRRRLLQLMRAHPLEAHRPALRIAVADVSPTVRADALRAFSALPGEVKPEEIENTLNDPDPRVKAALTELRKAKGVEDKG